MTTATKASSRVPFGRRSGLVVLALWAGSLGGGCASWSSTATPHPTLLRALWKRPSDTAPAPGYDYYAEAVAAAKPELRSRAFMAQSGVKTRPGDPTSDQPMPDLVAQAEANKNRPATRGRWLKSRDTSIRVTLGRPEQLPTLTDPGTALDTRLAAAANSASAPVSNWKRGAKPKTVAETNSQKTSAQADASVRKDAASPDQSLKELLSDSRNRLHALSTYQVNIKRIELVGGRLQAEEEAILSIRRNPKAVRLEWPDGPSKGREVLYSAALNDRMMYVNMGNPSLLISRMSIPVDSPIALRNSRHPITEAGFDTILDKLFQYMDDMRQASAKGGKLAYRGLERPKGLDKPCHLIERISPDGETWSVFLDPSTLMPAMVTAVKTGSGELIERYTYRNLRPNPSELASADAFDPDKRWGESKGLLSRLARSSNTSADAKSASITTR
ncbi:MAG: DUF1571 domain-containing protein [Planctomycetaceae bacterium]|nr:DUF1571 domain-containing protein [Planctomycetaceae bacterium]